jgi:hypothetical protein
LSHDAWELFTQRAQSTNGSACPNLSYLQTSPSIDGRTIAGNDTMYVGSDTHYGPENRGLGATGSLMTNELPYDSRLVEQASA